MNRNVVRNSVVATVLVHALLFFTQFARAAQVPRRLQLAIQKQQAQQAAPIARQTPPATCTSPEAEAQARVASAHNLFLVNDGADDSFPRTTEGYDRFVADMQNWGQYHLVSSVADADLVLQLRSAPLPRPPWSTTPAMPPPPPSSPTPISSSPSPTPPRCGRSE